MSSGAVNSNVEPPYNSALLYGLFPVAYNDSREKHGHVNDKCECV